LRTQTAGARAGAAATNVGADPFGTAVFPRPQLRTAMLTKDFPFLLPRNVGGTLPAALRRLGDDLDRVHAGSGPAAVELANAPLIVDWRCVLTPVGLRLEGFVAGHPLNRNGPVLTSQLWAADPGGAWIRTMSRFYRLGVRSRAHVTAGLDHPDAAADFEGGL
jgi:hypothetical protein